MTLQVSASKTELLLQCARPFEEGIETSDEPGEGARYGSIFHGLMELPTLKVDTLIPAAEKLQKRFDLEGVTCRAYH